MTINLVWLFVWYFFARRLNDYPLVHFLKDIVPFALTAGVVMLATQYLTGYVVETLTFVGDYARLWLLLISRIVVFGALYFLVMKLFRARILDETLAFFKNKFKH